MKVEDFVSILNADYYTGVPDSQLKSLCNYLIEKYGIDQKHHVIAANEGNATALAAGYHLATGKRAVVYMQNSGEGNIINPVASLLDEHVYGIPVIFVIGWRGEPGVHDEPQHVYQGMVTTRLLDDMQIAYYEVGKETSTEAVKESMDNFEKILSAGKSVAFVIHKGALSYDGKPQYNNNHTMLREEIIRHITAVSDEDPIVSTTGKASRELFEIREQEGRNHSLDFLTVGSMGHASSIALGIAAQKPDKRVWCIDGDGAVLMHMGAMALVGSSGLDNLVHIMINNGAHETVGGMPTVAEKVHIVDVARACGYTKALSVSSFEELDEALSKIKSDRCLTFLEIESAIGARENLGRPTTTPKENKEAFMKALGVVL